MPSDVCGTVQVQTNFWMRKQKLEVWVFPYFLLHWQTNDNSRTAAATKKSKQKAFALDTKILCYTLQTVTPTSLTHNVVLIDNCPVTVISNVHAGLDLTAVKRWDPPSRNYFKIDFPYCITKYNKCMDRLDSLDALASVYWIDVRCMKCYWLHYINTFDILKSAEFKVLKLVNPDAKMDSLAFTGRVAMNFLRAAKMRRQLPPQTSFIQEKDPGKETQQFQQMKETKETTLLNNFLRKFSQYL